MNVVTQSLKRTGIAVALLFGLAVVPQLVNTVAGQEVFTPVFEATEMFAAETSGSSG